MNLPRPALTPALLAIGALLALPSAAAASPGNTELAGGGQYLFAKAGFGDTTPHAITVSYSGGAYLVRDSAGTTAGEGCVQQGATTAVCPDAGVNTVAIYGSAAADTLRLDSAGPSLLFSFLSENELLGGGGDDTIIAHEDTIANPGGAAGFDYLGGADGNDYMDGGYGPDQMVGGRGTDTVSYASRGASEPLFVSIDPNEPSARPDGARGEGDDAQVENVIGGAGNDKITVSGSNAIQDSGNANTFTGGAGNDRLLGGAGADHLNGGTGKDKLFGGKQKDVMNGGAGKDRCVGGPSKDRAKKCERKASV